MIPAFLEEIRTRVDAHLDRLLPPEEGYAKTLYKAMRYSVFAGGKRIRPAVVILAARACGTSDEEEKVLNAACAVEMVHTYSLIHDDLPAMDDDDTRRGKPTCHKVFGEAIAILAGDALLTLAFEVTSSMPRVTHILARAAGHDGMVGGQVVDMESEGTNRNWPGQKRKEVVSFIHATKTAALIRASALIGGVVAEAGEEETKLLEHYGRCLGTAFQIVDDILDVTGDASTMGKAVGKDIARGKLIYPDAYGLEKAREDAAALAEEAVEAAGKLGSREMVELARFVVSRRL